MTQYVQMMMKNCYLTADIFGRIYLHHQCYEYAKMAPVSVTWNNPLKVSGTTCHGSWHGPRLPDGDGLLDLLGDPASSFMGSLMV